MAYNKQIDARIQRIVSGWKNTVSKKIIIKKRATVYPRKKPMKPVVGIYILKIGKPL